MEQRGFHDPGRLIWDTPGEGRRVIKIGLDVWIGSNSVIGDDVGSRCVIATGSVVTKPIPDHTLAGGVPAKFIKSIQRPATAAISVPKAKSPAMKAGLSA